MSVLLRSQDLNKHQKHPALVLLDELLSIPSPPGHECRMRDLLLSKIRDMGYKPEQDAAGNVLVRLNSVKGKAPMILGAHMDEIALVVTRIESDGRLRVTRSGGLHPGKLGERMMDIVGDKEIIPGIISSGAGHGANQTRPLTWEDYWVITGLSPEQLLEKGVYVGAPLVPAREGRGPLVFGDPSNPLVAAWTFDDRMGVVALLRLLERLKKKPLKCARPVIVAFTVHEEGGAHGAKVLNHREQAEIFIAVDGCPIPPSSGLSMNGGPVVWAKDMKANYDARLVVAFQKVADRAGIPLQRAVLEAAYSDASASYDCGAVPRVGIFGHVRENSHGFEVSSVKMFDQVLEILDLFLREEAGTV